MVSSLQVGVPVLSLAITVHAPRASTAYSLRTITSRRAIHTEPTDNATVIATGCACQIWWAIRSGFIGVRRVAYGKDSASCHIFAMRLI